MAEIDPDSTVRELFKLAYEAGEVYGGEREDYPADFETWWRSNREPVLQLLGDRLGRFSSSIDLTNSEKLVLLAGIGALLDTGGVRSSDVKELTDRLYDGI